jgi:hypothetical protein
VTTYQKVCYWEAQTCCSLVDPCTGAVVASNGAAPAAATQPSVNEYPTPVAPAPAPTPASPGVQEYKSNGGGSGSPLYDRNYPRSTTPPEGSGSAMRNRTARQQPPQQAAPAFQPARAPLVPRLNSVAYDAPANTGPNLVGQVVAERGTIDRAVHLTFVSESASAADEKADVDGQGRFKVTLASGNWLIYSRDEQGKPVFQTRVSMRDQETQQMTLVSR